MVINPRLGRQRAAITRPVASEKLELKWNLKIGIELDFSWIFKKLKLNWIFELDF